MGTLITDIILAIIVVTAVLSYVKQLKKSGCSHNCTKCSRNCTKCSRNCTFSNNKKE